MMIADGEDTGGDCWAWKLRSDPGRRFLKSTKTPEQQQVVKESGGSTKAPQVQEDHRSSSDESDASVSNEDEMEETADFTNSQEVSELSMSTPPKHDCMVACGMTVPS